jgi:eukaryotic-like serine/threonine-protein kinase
MNSIPDAPEKLVAALSERYEVFRPLGAGGMATVYLARDLKHDREVAVKVLRPELAEAVGVDRFLDEISTTARLQHPHVLQLHDSGSAGEFLYYVMPYVQGDSLREKLDREEQLQIAEAVNIARSVGQALDYAHRNGVVHRDVKPANILLHEGAALVADFGVSHALKQAGGTRLTQTGVSVGTPSYMSPEQATGDHRPGPESDVYSLGCVLYEMLTGEVPFTGSTAQAILGKIVLGEAKPPTEVRYSTPGHVEETVLHALEKVPADRFPTAADFVRALGDPGFVRPGGETVRTPSGSERPFKAAMAVLALVGWIVVTWIVLTPGAPSSATLPTEIRSTIQLADAPLTFSGPIDQWQSSLALSRDGRWLAYSAWDRGTPVLYVRDMTTTEAVRRSGTEGAYSPFFSPDGDRIGFFAAEALKIVDTRGGPPRTVGEFSQPKGAAWTSDDRILVADSIGSDPRFYRPEGGSLGRVASTIPGLIAPSFLPGEEWVVATSNAGRIVVASLTDERWYAITREGLVHPDSVPLARTLAGSDPQYSASGHIIYLAGNDVGLMAIPIAIDGGEPEVLGPPTSVQSGVRREGIDAAFGHFAISDHGLLLFAPGEDTGLNHLALIGADGAVDTLDFPRDAWGNPRVSPDGEKILIVKTPQDGGALESWVLHMDGRPVKIDVGAGFNTVGWSWFPDSDRVLLALSDAITFEARGCVLYRLSDRKEYPFAADLCGNADVHPDGMSVVAHGRAPEYRMAIYDAEGKPMDTPDVTHIGHFQISPDGQWMASGQDFQLFVGPWPWTGQQELVSQGDRVAHFPAWAPDGETLYFWADASVWKVPLTLGERIVPGDPERLVVHVGEPAGWPFDVMPDGKLLVRLEPPDRSVDHLEVVANFFTVLSRLAPGR